MRCRSVERWGKVPVYRHCNADATCVACTYTLYICRSVLLPSESRRAWWLNVRSSCQFCPFIVFLSFSTYVLCLTFVRFQMNRSTVCHILSSFLFLKENSKGLLGYYAILFLAANDGRGLYINVLIFICNAFIIIQIYITQLDTLKEKKYRGRRASKEKAGARVCTYINIIPVLELKYEKAHSDFKLDYLATCI